MPVPSPVVSAPPSSAAPEVSASGPEQDPSSLPCDIPYLYSRFLGWPPSAALDAAGKAFDSAEIAFHRRMYPSAASGFMAAAAGFLAANDLKDRRWSYHNAVFAWSLTPPHLEEGRMALLEAAAHDDELAEELRGLAMKLHARCSKGP